MKEMLLNEMMFRAKFDVGREREPGTFPQHALLQLPPASLGYRRHVGVFYEFQPSSGFPAPVGSCLKTVCCELITSSLCAYQIEGVEITKTWLMESGTYLKGGGWSRRTKGRDLNRCGSAWLYELTRSRTRVKTYPGPTVTKSVLQLVAIHYFSTFHR